MTDPIFTASTPSQSVELAVSSPMQVLTLDELRAVVGGPVINNGGIAIAPTASPNKG